jgi:hypothetical protein
MVPDEGGVASAGGHGLLLPLLGLLPQLLLPLLQNPVHRGGGVDGLPVLGHEGVEVVVTVHAKVVRAGEVVETDLSVVLGHRLVDGLDRHRHRNAEAVRARMHEDLEELGHIEQPGLAGPPGRPCPPRRQSARQARDPAPSPRRHRRRAGPRPDRARRARSRSARENRVRRAPPPSRFSCSAPQALRTRPPSAPAGPRLCATRGGNVIPGSPSERVTVEIGGIPQSMIIQSVDRANPVLLFLHGGPRHAHRHAPGGGWIRSPGRTQLWAAARAGGASDRAAAAFRGRSRRGRHRRLRGHRAGATSRRWISGRSRRPRRRVRPPGRRRSPDSHRPRAKAHGSPRPQGRAPPPARHRGSAPPHRAPAARSGRSAPRQNPRREIAPSRAAASQGRHGPRAASRRVARLRPAVAEPAATCSRSRWARSSAASASGGRRSR